MAKKKEEAKEKCTCCQEEKVCTCDEKCNCEGNCECENCTCNEDKVAKNEYLEMAQRVQADFDNYRRRSADMIKNARIEGIVEAVQKIFPAIDVISKAKTMIKDDKVLEGVVMIEKELIQSLKNIGIEEIEVMGKPLDPNNANVIAVISDNSLEDGVVAQVYQAGYKLNDRVLRYAQVVVNKLN